MKKHYKMYTITYIVNDVFYEEESYRYNEEVKAIKDPYKEGYTFTGWDNEIVPVTDKVTYRATYSRELINPVTTLKGLKISFLGDSITTFYKEGSPVNSYYHEDGQYYYPKYCASVDSYEKTWWGQLYLNNENII